MNYPVVDFRKPARVPDDIGQMLSQWQANAREDLELRIGRYVAAAVKINPIPPVPVMGSDLRDSTDSSIVYRVDVGESHDVTLFIVERQIAITLVMEMLGAALEELPEDRELTDIETTCLDFVLNEISSSLERSQKLTPSRKLQVVGQTRLKELFSEFPADMTNFDVGFSFELPYGSGNVRWVLPQDVTLDMSAALPKTIQSNGSAQSKLKNLILSAPSELSVRLGSSEMQPSKLRSLSVGDVIVLDQRIDETLVGEIGGQPMFHGWCGRNGKHQVFQIHELIDGDADEVARR